MMKNKIVFYSQWTLCSYSLTIAKELKKYDSTVSMDLISMSRIEKNGDIFDTVHTIENQKEVSIDEQVQQIISEYWYDWIYYNNNFLPDFLTKERNIFHVLILENIQDTDTSILDNHLWYFKALCMPMKWDDFDDLQIQKSLKHESNIIFLDDVRFSDMLYNLHHRENICIFYPSYLQHTHIFVRDELRELERYYNIYIVTFNTDFLNSEYAQNSYRVIYNDLFSTLYDRESYPFIENYWIKQVWIYKTFLKYLSSLLKKNNIQTLITEFLDDGVFISPVKSLYPDVSIVSFARGRDIYYSFNRFSKKQQEIAKKYIDTLYVMDTHMWKYWKSIWFSDEVIEIFYVGKHLDLYTFTKKDFSTLSILIGWRFTQKKGILETLDFISELWDSEKVSIDSIYLIGEEVYGNELYKYKIFEKIQSSDFLTKKVIFLWMLSQEQYLDLIHTKVNMFIWHFQKAQDGDEDGIPNIIIENMLVWNLIFSTISWWIGDIVSDNETGVLLNNDVNDIQRLSDLLTDKAKILQITQNANNLINNLSDIKKQVFLFIQSFEKNRR